MRAGLIRPARLPFGTFVICLLAPQHQGGVDLGSEKHGVSDGPLDGHSWIQKTLTGGSISAGRKNGHHLTLHPTLEKRTTAFIVLEVAPSR